jgi:radical SAM protein with 4Fe4S-binding SPASM domain
MSARKRLIPCYAGALNLVLTETGDVYPCEMLGRRMGSVRETDYDLRELVRSDEARSVLGRIRANGCHCSHECYFMSNILFNPRQYPALLRESLYVR